ncbi:MAG: peptide ABC transporter substrate-binding protein, partial [bacterium]|nr:peptide ABC transporter substrate-binding protein [bacterium]
AEIPSLENGSLSPDGRWVVWKIKSGIRWSDGHPFTSGDIRFTWEYIRNPDNNATTIGVYESIKRIELLDDLTIKIIFKAPNPAWALPFIGAEGMILPRHVFEPGRVTEKNPITGEPFAALARVGTGPFSMTDLKVEDMVIIGDDVAKMVKIIYTANPFFREKGKPFFNRIELRGGGDAAKAAKAVLVDGSADFAWNLQLSGDRLDEMQKAGKGKMMYLGGPYVEWILLNFTDPNQQTESGERSSLKFPHPFFSDIRVRQAFAHAVNRQAIAMLYGNTASVTTNILVSPSIYRSKDTIHIYPFDLKRAAELLDNAGWKDHDGNGFRDQNGIPMRVLYQTSLNSVRRKTQEIIKKDLESIGVDVKLKAIDAGVFFGNNPLDDNNFHKFYADMQEYMYYNTNPDPTDYLGAWICEQAAQQANNWSYLNLTRWCNLDFDKLYRLVRKELDPDKRRNYFIRMNNLLIREVVIIPLVNRKTPVGVSTCLKGVRLTPWDRGTWNIKDWQRESSKAVCKK